ncbi:hypothetical protein N0V85_009511 [Neurospora sp. IMI 360204]|nr:hypothetical protein N0V85_009511 [Neurospora sp. IMI 360204]
MTTSMTMTSMAVLALSLSFFSTVSVSVSVSGSALPVHVHVISRDAVFTNGITTTTSINTTALLHAPHKPQVSQSVVVPSLSLTPGNNGTGNGTEPGAGAVRWE